MTGYAIIPVVIVAGAALLWLGSWVARRGGAGLVRNATVDHGILYQPLAALVAVVAALAAALLSSDPTRYLHLGDLGAPVSDLGWLGVSTSDTWRTIGITIGLIITAVTALVVFLQARKSGRLSSRALPLALLLSLPLAAINAATEEVIFRFAPATALGGVASMMTVAVLSGVLFGVPHYFGHPGKIPGVLLAGFLGWLACLSVLQTQGLLWAWSIHFVQDVVIFTILIAVPAVAVTPSGEGAAEDAQAVGDAATATAPEA